MRRTAAAAAVVALLALLASAAVLSVRAAECHGSPSPDAQPNMLPIYTQDPVYVKSVPNGKLYMAGSGDNQVAVVHVWGTAYEMGYAHGQLMKEQAVNMLTSLWAYLELQVEQAINGTVTWIPAGALKMIADLGLDGALDLTELATRPFTGKYFYDEIQGLADATGMSKTRIAQIHMIGELTKGACSMFGASGSATPDGNLLQLRALDWDTTGPFKNFPQVTVYHPSEDGHAFANIGWTGWIGSITGYSSKKMGVSEIGVSFPDDTFGKESRFGIPFTFILRDILQFDNSYQDSMKRFTDAHRTCDLILGFGDGNSNQFRGVQYSHSVCNFFTWDNMMPQADWHPRIQDIVYYGMDWLCPGYNEVLARQLNAYHGNITAELAIQQVTAIVQTGDLHIAYYDYANNAFFVATARKDGTGGPLQAYQRTFLRYDAGKLFAEPHP